MKAFPKDVEVTTMAKRHVGVESELGIKEARYNDMGAIEQECSRRGLLQSIGHDGGGREFRTNPIAVHTLSQVRGFKYLTEYYGVLRDSTTVLGSGGTHVHISILNSDHENMESNATAMGIAFYKQFQKISGRDSRWAGRRSGRTLEEVRQEQASGKSIGRKYYSRGGMLSPTHRQTLEFRGPKGSNDSQEILAWVEFLDNVVRACNRKSIEGVAFKELLKGERVSAYVESLKGWRKLSKEDLERKFNGSNLTEVQ